MRSPPIALALVVAACSNPSPGPLAPDLALPDLRAPAEAGSDGGGEADRFLGKDRDRFFDDLVAAIDGLQVGSAPGLKRLGLSWSEALASTRARFRTARTAADVYYALLALQRSFHDVHSRFELGPGELAVPGGPAVALPIRLRAEYPSGAAGPVEYVVTAVEPAEAASIAIGSRLVSLDGRPVAELERELVAWLRGSSPEALRESVARWLTRRHPVELPAPPLGSTVTLQLLPPQGGQTYERTLTWREPKPTSAPLDPCLAGVAAFYRSAEEYPARQPELVGINLCVYPGGDPQTRVVRWFSFFYEFSDVSGGDPGLQGLPSLRERLKHTSFKIAESELPFLPGEKPPSGRIDAIALSLMEIDRLFAHLGPQGAKRLLIDLRENGGGNFDPSWVAPFSGKPFKQLATEVHFRAGLRATPTLLDQAEGGPQAQLAKAYLLAHPTAEKSPLYPFICRSSSCAPAEIDVPGAPQPYAAAVVLLTGPDCVSSCDNYVSLIRDNGLGKLAGLPPRGGDSPVRLPLVRSLQNGQPFSFVLTVAVNYRPGGQVLEGNPPAPDFPVAPSASNRGKYLEAVLSAVAWP
jgi:hypothetical protein